LTCERATLQLSNSKKILLFLPQPGSLNYQLHVVLTVVELGWVTEKPPVTKYHTSLSPHAKSTSLSPHAKSPIRRRASTVRYEEHGRQ